MNEEQFIRAALVAQELLQRLTLPDRMRLPDARKFALLLRQAWDALERAANCALQCNDGLEHLFICYRAIESMIWIASEYRYLPMAATLDAVAFSAAKCNRLPLSSMVVAIREQDCNGRFGLVDENGLHELDRN